MSSSASSNKRSTWKRLRRSDTSVTSLCNQFAKLSITPGASTSSSSITKSFEYDVFLSFSGQTRNNFLGHLYEALKQRGIVTYKDDKNIKKGKEIGKQLMKSIEDSRCYIIVFSKKYASSSWCLDELVKIMECQKMTGRTAFPVFYDVEPTEVRKRSGAVGKAFAKHEKEVKNQRRVVRTALFTNKKKAKLKKWKRALKEAANLAGWELKNTNDGNEAEFIKKVIQDISLEFSLINLGFDEKLVGMETRVRDFVSSLKMVTDEVRMIGIKGMGGAGKTTTARAVFDNLSPDFEATSFVENVREVSKASLFGLKNLQEQVLSDMLKEHVTVNGVLDGIKKMGKRMCCKKVLLVLDDVDHLDQLEALAGKPEWFKQGSIIIITTRDEQVLVAHRVHMIREINLLSDKEAICLFSRLVFQRENPLKEYEELTQKVVCYAAGMPLIVKVLGSFLTGSDKAIWVDAIDRLKRIPLNETLEKLKLSYNSLERDYKQIFLDIACVLKGEHIEYAIRVLECCGFHARNGLKVLEQRSLITISKDEVLGMHDRIEEMGKDIVRSSHPDEPNQHSRPNEPNEHSRLWIKEEIEDILAKGKGTEKTRCLKLYMPRVNARTVMKGLGKMKKLRYLDVNFADYDSESSCESYPKFDDTSQYFTNSLNYLKCTNYPFLYLPKTFLANNLFGLEMEDSRMVQLWEEGEEKVELEEGEEKVLRELNFLSLYKSKLTTFDFRMTPSLETLILRSSDKLVELCMPVSCQKLKHLDISDSKLTTFDLRLTPNLETLSLDNCADFEELHVSVACPNLKFLNLCNSRLRSLNLELIPNLERLDLAGCDKLVEINAPVGCLKNVVHLNLSYCFGFAYCVFSEPKINCSSATLTLLDFCRLHPNINLLWFPLSSVGNNQKLISSSLCACPDFKIFSDTICSLRYLKKLKLIGDIPEFPKYIGQLECPEKIHLSSTTIEHLPYGVCMLKHLKSLTVHFDLLEKLPEGLGRLEFLEKLKVSSKKIEYLPESICMLKRLKFLDVTNCFCLGKLPEEIGLVEDLEKLELSASLIKHLPDSICKLKHLKCLKLDHCALLEKLPQDLGRLECLEEIVITHTGISHLPYSIFGLKGLLITASSELLELYDFPSEIKTTGTKQESSLMCFKVWSQFERIYKVIWSRLDCKY